MILTTTPFEDIQIGDTLPAPWFMAGREYQFKERLRCRITYVEAKSRFIKPPEDMWGVVTEALKNEFYVVATQHEYWWLFVFERS